MVFWCSIFFKKHYKQWYNKNERFDDGSWIRLKLIIDEKEHYSEYDIQRQKVNH